MMNFRRRKRTWNHLNLEPMQQVSLFYLFLKLLSLFSFNILYIFISIAEKVNELQDLLSKKDQEMKAMEAKYKKYLEKAKSVSYTTHVSLSVTIKCI